MISIKIHKSYRLVVAICDSNLLGKKFEEGNRQLDLRENFFKDKNYNEKEAIEIMKYQKCEDATFNIIGENSIHAALEAKIISKESVSKIDNIPFTLILI
jgi:uncharacterized protein